MSESYSIIWYYFAVAEEIKTRRKNILGNTVLRKEQKLLLTKSFRVSALCHAHICDVTLGIFHHLSKDLRSSPTGVWSGVNHARNFQDTEKQCSCSFLHLWRLKM